MSFQAEEVGGQKKEDEDNWHGAISRRLSFLSKSSLLGGGLAAAANRRLRKKLFLGIPSGAFSWYRKRSAVWLEYLGFDVIGPEAVDDLLHVSLHRLTLQGEDRLDAMEEVSLHPVGAAEDVKGITGILG